MKLWLITVGATFSLALIFVSGCVPIQSPVDMASNAQPPSTSPIVPAVQTSTTLAELEQLTTEQIMAKIYEAHRTMSYHAVYSSTQLQLGDPVAYHPVDAKRYPSRSILELWQQNQDRWRLESNSGLHSTIVNGTQRWQYSRADNSYAPFDQLEGDTLELYRFFPVSFTYLFLIKPSIEKGADTSQPSLHFVGAGEVIAGRPTYQFATGNATTQASNQIRLWIDAEKWLVLQLSLPQQFTTGKNEAEKTETALAVEYEPALPDDIFEIPKGAQRRPPASAQMEFTTVEEAQAEVDFPILQPTQQPDGYVLDHVRVSTQYEPAGDHVALTYYQREGESIIGELVIEQVDMPAALPEVGAPILVGANPARLFSNGAGELTLVWIARSQRLIVRGTVDLDLLLQIAASLVIDQ